MLEEKPGSEGQVFSSGDTPDKWFPAKEDAAAPSGKDGSPNSADNKEVVVEKKAEGDHDGGDDAEKNADKDKSQEKKDEDLSKKKEEKDDDRETFKKSFEKGDAKPLPEKKEKHPPLKDGDYSVEDDGEIIIHAKHIVDDYESILEDTKVFSKIFNSKKNREKAEFIAEKLLGFEGDGIRSAGQIANDIFNAYAKAKTDKDAQKIAEEHFPDLLKDSETELNATFLPSEEKEKADAKSDQKEDGHVTEKDMRVALKLWKAESDINIDIDKALDDPDMFEEFNSVRFDAETGEALSVDDRVAIAAEIVYGDKSMAPAKKEILSGGEKKGELPKKAAAKEEKSVFSSSVRTAPKEWY